MLDDKPCFACDGKGWFESDESEEQDIDFDFSILGDEAAAGDAPDTVAGGDIFDEQGESGSVLDIAAPLPGPPSSGKDLQDRGPLDPETELGELQKQQKRTKQRIAVLESLVAGGLSRTGQPKAAQPDDKAPTSTDGFLKLLQESQLLDPKQLHTAQVMGNDPKVFAKRLLDAKMLSEWQATQLLKGRTKLLLGKHKLIRVIGTGSMGVVFLANHVTMNRQVALKVYSRELVQNNPFLDRFLTQTGALGGLDHRNLVQVYTVDKFEDYYYLVMEYVQGRNLEQVVGAKGPLKFAVSADIICQAATGLHHLHANNIFHQEVRPSKLLVDRSNLVKVAHPGLGGKSINYRAPECTRAGGAVDGRTDVYSLGCTLYFFLTGKPPFPKGLSPEELRKRQQAEVKGIQAVRPDTPLPLVKLCEKMMAKKPDDRFPTCQAVVQTLVQLTRGLIKADTKPS